MTDIFDLATEREEEFRDDALKAQQRQAEGHGINAGKTVADSLRTCTVCNGEIPLRRRRAIPGVQTCVDCQVDLEYALRGRARPHYR